MNETKAPQTEKEWKPFLLRHRLCTVKFLAVGSGNLEMKGFHLAVSREQQMELVSLLPLRLIIKYKLIKLLRKDGNENEKGEKSGTVHHAQPTKG